MKANPGGNEQLTAVAGILLIVFLAVEGATLLDLQALLTVHAFVGMFLLPILALKMGSTGWRMASYYLGREEYVRRGPPAFQLRMIVAPVVIASTLALFGTGIYLLAVHEVQGTPRSGCTRRASSSGWSRRRSTCSRGSYACRRRCARGIRASGSGSASSQ
ncbi:MAG TPA: hypothetical protein VGK62_08465 [Gaiellaceae bacterium]